MSQPADDRDQVRIDAATARPRKTAPKAADLIRSRPQESGVRRELWDAIRAKASKQTPKQPRQAKQTKKAEAVANLRQQARTIDENKQKLLQLIKNGPRSDADQRMLSDLWASIPYKPLETEPERRARAVAIVEDEADQQQKGVGRLITTTLDRIATQSDARSAQLLSELKLGRESDQLAREAAAANTVADLTRVVNGALAEQALSVDEIKNIVRRYTPLSRADIDGIVERSHVNAHAIALEERRIKQAQKRAEEKENKRLASLTPAERLAELRRDREKMVEIGDDESSDADDVPVMSDRQRRLVETLDAFQKTVEPWEDVEQDEFERREAKRGEDRREASREAAEFDAYLRRQQAAELRKQQAEQQKALEEQQKAAELEEQAQESQAMEDHEYDGVMANYGHGLSLQPRRKKRLSAAELRRAFFGGY